MITGTPRYLDQAALHESTLSALRGMRSARRALYMEDGVASQRFVEHAVASRVQWIARGFETAVSERRGAALLSPLGGRLVNEAIRVVQLFDGRGRNDPPCHLDRWGA